MSKTIMITGASSGIGKSTAQYFHDRGWNVAATMRNPEPQPSGSPRLRYYKLDVTDTGSIKLAVEQIVADFGRIDVVVNNAGYGAVGLFEAATEKQIKRQFETNLFGLMYVTRSLLPHFRSHNGGLFINVSSMGGRVTFPLYSLYHSSKWAVEGFTESLQYELKPLGIRVKLIEPGVIRTDFNTRSLDFFNDDRLQEYQSYIRTAMKNIEDSYKNGVGPEVVARTIFKAATDRSRRLRYGTGSPAPWLLPLRKLLPDSWFFGLIRGQIERN